MLEKLLGCNLVTKLRAILLMEADFNATNKIIYASRMMDTVRRHGMMPEDCFSEKGRECTDGTLAKTLFYDVTRQSRVPAALASVDASNCYERIELLHLLSFKLLECLLRQQKVCWQRLKT